MLSCAGNCGTPLLIALIAKLAMRYFAQIDGIALPRLSKSDLFIFFLSYLFAMRSAL